MIAKIMAFIVAGIGVFVGGNVAVAVLLGVYVYCNVGVMVGVFDGV